MNKATTVEFHIIATCLWCEKQIPFKENIEGKMFCSKKCLKELKAALEKEHGKGTCGYDMQDVCKGKVK